MTAFRFTPAQLEKIAVAGARDRVDGEPRSFGALLYGTAHEARASWEAGWDSPRLPKGVALRVSVVIEVETNHPGLVEFLELCGLGGQEYDDIFSPDHCGHWLTAIEWDVARGWLCRLVDDDDGNVDEDVRQTWASGADLPPGWFAMTRTVAYRAVEIGIRRHGPGFWGETADANDYDHVIQLALLGEITYPA